MEDTIFFIDEGFLDKLTKFFGDTIRLKFDKFEFAKRISKKQSLFCKHLFYYTAPIITTTAVTQIDENQDYSYDVDATDADGDTLTYSLTTSPSWLSINSNTGVITGTAPEVDDDIDYPVTVQVSDGNGGSAIQTYTLTVNNDEDKKDKKKTTTYFYQSNYDEQLYLNQFKSPKIIYLEDDDQPEKVLNWFQKFIEWLKNLFGF